MEVAEMRRLLNESKSSGKPLGCAVGMSKDMKNALLLLHKMHQGPEVGRNLKKDVPDIVNLRFGTAQIDADNPKLVRLVLNRAVTGVAKKLVKTLKGTGYNKVKLGLEDGTEFEGAEDEEEAQAQAQDAAAAPAAPAGEAAKAAPAAPAAEPPRPAPAAAAEPAAGAAAAAAPPPPPPPPKDDAPPDAEALKKELAALAARIPAVAAGDAAKSAALVKLAREGQVNLATNNLKYAAASVEQLRRAMQGGPAGGPAAAAAPPPPPPPPPPQQAAKPDAAALKQELEALARRIPEAAAGDAKRTAELVKLARDGQVNIATNNLAYAATAIAQLRTAIEGKAAAAAAPVDVEKTLNFVRRLKLLIGKAADGDQALEAQWMAMATAAEGQLAGGDIAAGGAGVEALRLAMLPAVTRMQDEAKASGAYTSSGKKWLELRQTIEDEMERLRMSIAGAYQGDAALAAIEKAFRDKAATVMRTLDASLATKLEAAGKASKPDERQKLVEEAHGILDGYKAFAANSLLADLDDNPFTPLTLQSSLNATLSELAGAIH